MAQALITSDPKIMMGKPTLSGTRITVELILDKLAAGESSDQILSEHPRLTAEGIRAAIAFAAEVLRADVVIRYRKLESSIPGAYELAPGLTRQARRNDI